MVAPALRALSMDVRTGLGAGLARPTTYVASTAQRLERHISNGDGWRTSPAPCAGTCSAEPARGHGEDDGRDDDGGGGDAVRAAAPRCGCWRRFGERASPPRACAGAGRQASPQKGIPELEGDVGPGPATGSAQGGGGVRGEPSARKRPAEDLLLPMRTRAAAIRQGRMPKW
eukprot:scaffold215_cov423-Prasinococcus_capsulatus_cf.AAC.3